MYTLISLDNFVCSYIIIIALKYIIYETLWCLHRRFVLLGITYRFYPGYVRKTYKFNCSMARGVLLFKQIKLIRLTRIRIIMLLPNIRGIVLMIFYFFTIYDVFIGMCMCVCVYWLISHHLCTHNMPKNIILIKAFYSSRNETVFNSLRVGITINI